MSPETTIVVYVGQILKFLLTFPWRIRDWKRDRTSRQLSTEEARRRWETQRTAQR